MYLDSICKVEIQSGDMLLQYLYRIICYSKLICKNMAIKLLGAGAVTVCVQSVQASALRRFFIAFVEGLAVRAECR